MNADDFNALCLLWLVLGLILACGYIFFRLYTSPLILWRRRPGHGKEQESPLGNAAAQEEEARLHAKGKEFTKPFEVAKIAPRIEQVRRDYVAEINMQPGRASQRRLLALARQIVTTLAFFRQQAEQHELRRQTSRL
jgi:hypothetical protein